MLLKYYFRFVFLKYIRAKTKYNHGSCFMFPEGSLDKKRKAGIPNIQFMGPSANSIMITPPVRIGNSITASNTPVNPVLVNKRTLIILICGQTA